MDKQYRLAECVPPYRSCDGNLQKDTWDKNHGGNNNIQLVNVYRFQ